MTLLVLKEVLDEEEVIDQKGRGKETNPILDLIEDQDQ
jgi:hypothetical protein